jgi:hypothetical protein
VMGHQLIFSALLDSSWTRLSVHNIWDAQAQSTGLQRPPDLNPLDVWLWGYRWLIQRRSMTLSYYSNEYIVPVKSSEWNLEFWTECAPLCEVVLKGVLKFVEIHRASLIPQ